MDLSGLIFVALAVAWAAYLIPKALRHHDDDVRGRSVDRFSDSIRVLARREPVSSTSARLVVPGTRSGSTDARASSPAPADAVRRSGATRATKRRRVLGLLLVITVAVAAACGVGRLPWVDLAIPVALLAAWLGVCRVMVRGEHARAAARPGKPIVPSPAEGSPSTDATTVAAPTRDSAQAEPEPRDPNLWDPVPTTLPTYVNKPPARRTVRTIDLDSSGVWTSGRTDGDAAIAREAEAADRARRAGREAGRNGGADETAVGS